MINITYMQNTQIIRSLVKKFMTKYIISNYMTEQTFMNYSNQKCISQSILKDTYFLLKKCCFFKDFKDIYRKKPLINIMNKSNQFQRY